MAKSIEKFVNEALAIETETAREAGAIGYMCRALALATMPHSKQKGSEFTRRNGAFSMTMLARSDIGLPYGTVPRLLTSWITTEAFITKKRELVLGTNLSHFMGQLGMVPSGGRWGSVTRLRNQIRRLLSSSIIAVYDADDGWAHKSVQMFAESRLWWEPHHRPEQTLMFESTLTLGEEFFREVTERPFPIDIRVLKILGRSPLAIDIYVWLTYRMSYLRKPTAIPWECLQAQFGSGYPNTPRGLADFRRAFRKSLKKVLDHYRANAEDTAKGLLLRPGRTHIPKKDKVWG